ncbi:hypothetical protein ACFX2H_021816 [Malus domestica]
MAVFSRKFSSGFSNLQLLKQSKSANSEFESSIKGAIAHCKQSQQLLSSRMQFVRVNNGSQKACVSEIPQSSLINPTATHSKSCVSEIPHLILHSRPADFDSKVWFFDATVQFQTNTKKEEQSMSGQRLNEKITAEFVRLVLDEVAIKSLKLDGIQGHKEWVGRE